MWDNVYELKLLKMPLISLCHSALCATSCHKKEITMYKWPTVVSDDSHLWNITGFHFVVIFLPFILHARNIYIFICDATESQELNRITKLLQWEGRISSPMPCSKQGQHCIRSPEAFTSEGWRSLHFWRLKKPHSLTLSSHKVLQPHDCFGCLHWTPVYRCFPLHRCSTPDMV